MKYYSDEEILNYLKFLLSRRSHNTLSTSSSARAEINTKTINTNKQKSLLLQIYINYLTDISYRSIFPSSEGFSIKDIPNGLRGNITILVWVCQRTGYYNISFSGHIKINKSDHLFDKMALVIDNGSHISQTINTKLGLSNRIAATANDVLLIEGQIVKPLVYVSVKHSIDFELVDCVFNVHSL
jgi:hypothetical protein